MSHDRAPSESPGQPAEEEPSAAAPRERGSKTNNGFGSWASAIVSAIAVQLYFLAGLSFVIPAVVALLVGAVVHFWGPARLKAFAIPIGATAGYSVFTGLLNRNPDWMWFALDLGFMLGLYALMLVRSLTIPAAVIILIIEAFIIVGILQATPLYPLRTPTQYAAVVGLVFAATASVGVIVGCARTYGLTLRRRPPTPLNPLPTD